MFRHHHFDYDEMMYSKGCIPIEKYARFTIDVKHEYS